MMAARRELPRLIGVVHLPALAGAPGSANEPPATALQKAGYQAVREAKVLAAAGFEGVILENFGDAPFFKGAVPPETVASLAIIAAAVRDSIRIPLGVNVLRNDGHAALAVAAVTGADFIRVNVLSGVAATDQGIVEGDAATLIRERLRLGADVRILADVHVKHARTLSSDSVELAVEEMLERGDADGVIVTGPTTGRSVDYSRLEDASRSARRAGGPLYVGSGATPPEIKSLLRFADGIIVGSSIRKGRKAGAPLDPSHIREFVKAFRAASRPAKRGKRK